MGNKDKALAILHSEKGTAFLTEMIWELTVAARDSRSKQDSPCATMRDRLAGYLEVQHRLAGVLRESDPCTGVVDVDASFLNVLQSFAETYSCSAEVGYALHRSVRRFTYE